VLLSFNPFILLLWIAAVFFIPGSMVSFSLLRNSRFNTIEKLFIGFGIGLVALPLIPFILYIVAGVKYSFSIAVFSAAVFYIAAFALFVKSKTYEDFKLPTGFTPSIGIIIPILLIIILFVSFWIRFVTYSPVFYELDPYFYTYTPQQILTLGENPTDDRTAWYPDVVVSHRISPSLAYMEALWYSFYTGGGQYDNMLLSVIASIYPAVAATLAVFFLYLLVSSWYRREWGLLAAGIASFAPMFLYKTSAGVMEIQPFAFFTLAFFLSMYVLMLKEKKILFAGLAAIAYAGLTLGTSSEMVGLATVVIALPVTALFYYLKESDPQEIKTLVLNNAVVFLFGTVLAGSLLKGFFTSGKPSFFYPLIFFAMLGFAGLLLLARMRIPDGTARRMALAGIILVALLIYFFSPIGTIIREFISSALSIAQYNTPLDRTIAEQNPANADLSGSFGFIGAVYPQAVDLVMGIPSAIVNYSIAFAIFIFNWLFGTNIDFEFKTSGLLLLWILLFAVALAYSFYRLVKGEDTPVFVFAAIVFPPLLIGIIKAKYTIYAAFLLAGGIGLIFGEAEILIRKYFPAKKEGQPGTGNDFVYQGLAALAGILLLAQFFLSAGGFAPAMLSQSFKTRYQDNPGAFASKFSSICSTLAAQGGEASLCSMYSNSGISICSDYYDASICTVAADPLAYANTSTNAQFSKKLCYYSLIGNITNPKSDELAAASFRCQALSPYWIESMEWIRNSTPEGSVFISWWDYGHWINFLGQRNTVLRNEHASHEMIGDVAHAYLDSTPEELASYMESKNSSYAIFDKELTGDLGNFGGKYGALNYLMCARDNQTNVSYQPTMSQCEAEHLWETVYMPKDTSNTTCTISKSGNKTGVLVYKAYWSWSVGTPLLYTPSYPYVSGYPCYGTYLQNQNILAVCQKLVTVKPAYCLGDVLFADGTKGYGVYLLNETDPNGDLLLNKALLSPGTSYSGTYHLGDVFSITLVYTEDKYFLVNGNATGGYQDARTKFYASSLYRALFLDELPGFTQVFKSKDGNVKIYKING